MSAVRQAEIAGLPPFAGGAVGFFGFDCVRAVERLPGAQPGRARAAGHGADAHRRDRRLRPSQATRSRSSPTRTSTRTPTSTPRTPAPSRRSARFEPGSPARCRRWRRTPRGRSRTFESNMSREQFEANVARIIEYIRAGDAYQVVPSQRWTRAEPGRAVQHLPRAARGEPVAVHVLPRLRGLPDRRRVARAAADGQRPPRLHPPDRRHPPARRGRRRDRRRAARRREGARRARDARRPRPQRPRPRVRARQRARRAPDGGRDVLARHPHRLPGRGDAARGRARDRRARLRPARRARSPAPPRSARSRSSTSSSRSSAARTAARSAGSPTRASWTPASASARS